MADTKDPIRLVAVETGFAMGRLVHPGETFLFAPLDRNGKERKIPKWAALPAEAKERAKKPIAGDLKPKAAQEAVKVKTGELANGTP